MRPGVVLTLLSLSIPATVAAQVTARQATPTDVAGEETIEINDPMLLDVPLQGATGKLLSDPSVAGRTYYGTKQYVCDKARVPKITVVKKPRRDGGLDLEVTPTITSGWPRQDIDIKLAIVSGEKELQSKTWDDLTVGADDSTANKLTGLSPVAAFAASSTKRPIAVFSFKKGEFEALFEGEGPKLRLILDIQE
jgi:hypothetical protein